LIGFLSVFEGA